MRKSRVKKLSLKGINSLDQLLDRDDCSCLIESLIKQKNDIKGMVVTVIFKDGEAQTMLSGINLLQAIGALEAGKCQLFGNDYETFGEETE